MKDLEEKIEELHIMIAKHQAEDEAFHSFIKEEQEKPTLWSKFNIGTIITILVLCVSIIGSWFTLKASVSEVQNSLEKVTLIQSQHANNIRDIQLKGVKDSSDIQHIKEQVDSFSEKLDRLLEK